MFFSNDLVYFVRGECSSFRNQAVFTASFGAIANEVRSLEKYLAIEIAATQTKSAFAD
ncbi:MAG: hypothetical protein F6K28_25015 [Microcoleus sp. SIO2G3]|nr:hypothetical protein [Microcoleus sp. SIO2G3]